MSGPLSLNESHCLLEAQASQLADATLLPLLALSAIVSLAAFQFPFCCSKLLPHRPHPHASQRARLLHPFLMPCGVYLPHVHGFWSYKQCDWTQPDCLDFSKTWRWVLHVPGNSSCLLGYRMRWLQGEADVPVPIVGIKGTQTLSLLKEHARKSPREPFHSPHGPG